MGGHLYTVEFRVYSETLDPSAITKDLGLQPSQVRLQGSRRSDGRIWTGMWAYDGSAGDKKIDWNSLEEGIVFVLDQLLPHEDAIARYRPCATLLWWCGHFQSSFDGGPRLSPSLLKRLGDFGVELFVDTYFSNEGEAEQAE